MSLKKTLEEYDRQKDEFKKTHRPVECWECCCAIRPGDDIWVRDDRIYCSAECLAYHCDGYKASFQEDGVDDDGYRDSFPSIAEP